MASVRTLAVPERRCSPDALQEASWCEGQAGVTSTCCGSDWASSCCSCHPWGLLFASSFSMLSSLEQAAPTAVMVGSGVAAAHGILIKVRSQNQHVPCLVSVMKPSPRCALARPFPY